MTCRTCATPEQWRARFREVIDVWFVELVMFGPDRVNFRELADRCAAAADDADEWPDEKPERLS